MDKKPSKDDIKKKKAKKARRALSRVRKTLAKKETLPEDQSLSDWEDEFIGSLEERLDEYGAAFADPEKGNADDALSYRQAAKLREIEKKTKGKGKKPMKRTPFGAKKARKSVKVDAPPPDVPLASSPRPVRKTPAFRVITGGKKDGA